MYTLCYIPKSSTYGAFIDFFFCFLFFLFLFFFVSLCGKTGLGKKNKNKKIKRFKGHFVRTKEQCTFVYCDIKASIVAFLHRRDASPCQKTAAIKQNGRLVEKKKRICKKQIT